MQTGTPLTIVWFSDVILISVGFHQKARQTKRLEDVFTCDISTAVITIAMGPTRRKQPQRGGLIIFKKGNERML